MSSIKPYWRRPLFLGVVGVLALTAVATSQLLRQGGDGMEAYPHAFIARPGYDPAEIQFVTAPIEAPPSAPPGFQPAWQCVDPAFGDDQGRPWLFPMETQAEATPVPPLHPRLGRRPGLQTCGGYRSAEAERQLAAYRQKRQP